jgi:hypothetical protein
MSGRGQPMSTAEVLMAERRYQPPHDHLLAARCRSCRTWVPLEPRRVEVVNAHAYYLCPECESHFLIRWNDVVALGRAPTTAVELPPLGG